MTKAEEVPQKASHQRSRYRDECMGCLRDAFLRPVDVFPGFAGPDCLVTSWLCLECRLDCRDDRWISLVSTFLHHVRREARECAQWALEWKDGLPVACQEVQP